MLSFPMIQKPTKREESREEEEEKQKKERTKWRCNQQEEKRKRFGPRMGGGTIMDPADQTMI